MSTFEPYIKVEYRSNGIYYPFKFNDYALGMGAERNRGGSNLDKWQADHYVWKNHQSVGNFWKQQNLSNNMSFQMASSKQRPTPRWKMHEAQLG